VGSYFKKFIGAFSGSVTGIGVSFVQRWRYLRTLHRPATSIPIRLHGLLGDVQPRLLPGKNKQPCQVMFIFFS
jgi:hypothetical protein